LLEIGPVLRGLRQVAGDQLHLTLAFVGDLDQEALQRLHEKLAAITVPAFLLPVAGVGTFGKPRPTTVWVGVGKGHPHLFALHKRVHDAMFAAGLQPELRAFRPHVTLARTSDVSAESLRPFLRSHETAELCLVQVSGFSLFSSALSHEGAEYTHESRFELPSA
jgi:RNA 2',3'-cyclic 3'-phosphodiesterase